MESIGRKHCFASRTTAAAAAVACILGLLTVLSDSSTRELLGFNRTDNNTQRAAASAMDEEEQLARALAASLADAERQNRRLVARTDQEEQEALSLAVAQSLADQEEQQQWRGGQQGVWCVCQHHMHASSSVPSCMSLCMHRQLQHTLLPPRFPLHKPSGVDPSSLITCMHLPAALFLLATRQLQVFQGPCIRLFSQPQPSNSSSSKDTAPHSCSASRSPTPSPHQSTRSSRQHLPHGRHNSRRRRSSCSSGDRPEPPATAAATAAAVPTGPVGQAHASGGQSHSSCLTQQYKRLTLRYRA